MKGKERDQRQKKGVRPPEPQERDDFGRVFGEGKLGKKTSIEPKRKRFREQKRERLVNVVEYSPAGTKGTGL